MKPFPFTFRTCLLAVLLAALSVTPALSQFVNGQPAAGVLGTTDFVTRPAPSTTAGTFAGPNGVALDPLTGKIFVVDRTNHRVLRWSSADALVDGSDAEAVLGQPDFVSGGSGLAADKFNNPIGGHVDDEGRLWIGDYGNNRVLRFDDAANKPNGAAADGVLGQPDFVTKTGVTSQTGMKGPVGIAVAPDGTLWVSNFSNHRVLRYDDAANKPNGGPADGVLGQVDFDSAVSACTQSGLHSPNSVAIGADGTLWVSDYSNRRVLRYDDAAGKPNGGPADGVLGKPDFVTGGSMLSREGFGTTRFVEIGTDGTLYMVGEGNHRVMIFLNAATLANGAPADFVLGQTDFESNDHPEPPTASSLRTPRAALVDDANGFLWVCDYNNRRVLRYEFSNGNDPALTLLSPAGGETWFEGGTYDISWLSNLVTAVDIDFSADGGATWSTVATAADAASGSYAWTVPAGLTTQARIRVTDSADPLLTDESGDFSIEAPTYAVTLVNPNGLQRWEAGATRNILFDTFNVANVSLDFSADDGATWTNIIASTPAAAGSYAWTVPTTPGDAYRVRVTDAGGSGTADMSDEAFAVVSEATGDEFDYVFFADSPTPVYYDPSWTFVNGPSTLLRSGVKIPVSPARSLVGNYALNLEWSSQEGGNWGAAIASIGWTGHDVTLADSLVFHIYTDQLTAQADLPCIYLEDLSNQKSAKLPLGTLMGNVAAGAWQRVALSVQVFLDNSGNADMTRIKTIFFGQQDADGALHSWYLDDVRMTGVEVITGEDGPLIVVLGSSTAAGAGASHPDSTWVGRYRNHVQDLYEQAQVVNLAVGGYTTYHLMPDDSTPPAGRPAPSVEHNITRALAYQPWAIIVNLPSNDVASGYSLQEQLANYEVITGLAADADVPIWISTTQPRNLDAASRELQHVMADTTLAIYGDHALDFWYGTAAEDGTILPQYDSGDGIHLNDAGHAVLYDVVVDSGIWELIAPSAVPGEEGDTPPNSSLRLFQNHPNPFNPTTEIVFAVGREGPVTLDIFDMRGHLVRRLVDADLPARTHSVLWDGRDDAGRAVSSGTYLYRVRTASEQSARSMVLVR